MTIDPQTKHIHGAACPSCGAPVGLPCTAVRRGKRVELDKPHGLRIKASKAAAAQAQVAEFGWGAIIAGAELGPGTRGALHNRRRHRKDKTSNEGKANN